MDTKHFISVIGRWRWGQSQFKLCSEIGSYAYITALTPRRTEWHHILCLDSRLTALQGACLFACTCVSVSPARLVDELLQPRFDLIVGEEGHVPRVSNRQAVPVPQQGRPRLHTHTQEKERESDSSDVWVNGHSNKSMSRVMEKYTASWMTKTTVYRTSVWFTMAISTWVRQCKKVFRAEFATLKNSMQLIWNHLESQNEEG